MDSFPSSKLACQQQGISPCGADSEVDGKLSKKPQKGLLQYLKLVFLESFSQLQSPARSACFPAALAASILLIMPLAILHIPVFVFNCRPSRGEKMQTWRDADLYQFLHVARRDPST